MNIVAEEYDFDSKVDECDNRRRDGDCADGIHRKDQD